MVIGWEGIYPKLKESLHKMSSKVQSSRLYQKVRGVEKDEFIFLCLFVSVYTVNKYVLSELRFTVPTVFQGWQTLSCVILLSGLIKLKKVKNDLQILDVKVLGLLVPALVSFTVSIVAGSTALADLPTPVFLAITNLQPAFLTLFMKKSNTSGVSLRVCGSAVILGTVMIILIYSTTPITSTSIVWLLGHVALNLFYYVYLSKLNLDLSNTTQIYYRNFFSVIFLFPISLYLDLLRWHYSGDWKFYACCFLSGILGTFLQIWTLKVLERPKFVSYEGLAKLITSVVGHYMFFADVEPFIWVLIVVGFFVCVVFLKSEEEPPLNAKSDIIMSISPPHMKRFSADEVSLI